MKLLRIALPTLALLLSAAGCSHSRVIVVDLVNASAEPVANIEVSYPEASFGKSALAPGATFEYRIKPTATGPLKISYINSRGQAKKNSLLQLRKNDEGAITIRLTQESAAPESRLK